MFSSSTLIEFLDSEVSALRDILGFEIRLMGKRNDVVNVLFDDRSSDATKVGAGEGGKGIWQGSRSMCW